MTTIYQQNSFIKDQWIAYIHSLQNTICAALEEADGAARFRVEKWERGENGGGGITRVIANGAVFEKGGVNTSVVFGKVTPMMTEHLHLAGEEWFAAGISLILHPSNPFVPTVHANFRYFELYDSDKNSIDQWFGGGADLTPYYLFEEDAAHFHTTFKDACAPFGEELYPKFKKWCDEYFVNKHRNHETRGIGGIFYDHFRPNAQRDAKVLLDFSMANGDAFLGAYLPIVTKRKEMPYNAQHKKWQEIRRGRYVEFNLLYDRGTLFGLKTDGRTESILMSLPPTVRFEYDYHPAAGSAEWELTKVLLQPRDWC